MAKMENLLDSQNAEVEEDISLNPQISIKVSKTEEKKKRLEAIDNSIRDVLQQLPSEARDELGFSVKRTLLQTTTNTLGKTEQNGESCDRLFEKMLEDHRKMIELGLSNQPAAAGLAGWLISRLAFLPAG